MGKRLHIAGAVIVGAAALGIGAAALHEAKHGSPRERTAAADTVTSEETSADNNDVQKIVGETHKKASDPRASFEAPAGPSLDNPQAQFEELKKKSLQGDYNAQEELWTFLIMGEERRTAEDVGMDPESYVQLIAKLTYAREINKALNARNYRAFLRAVGSLEQEIIDDEFLTMTGFSSKDAFVASVKNVPGINTEEFSSSAYIALRKLGIDHEEALQLTPHRGG